MKNVPIAKENGKGRLPIILTVAAVICLAVVFGMILRARITEKHLDTIQNQVLEELEQNAGMYDEQSVVLYNVSESVAKKLAEELNAELRSVQNGKYARLTLPEGTTIVDVYKNDGYREYLERMAVDYHVKTSEITDEEGNRVHNTSAPNYTVTDGYYNLQDYINYLHVGDAWSSYRGNGVTVAVIDTGIDTDHPEFAGRISEKSYNATEDKIVKDYLLEGDVYDWSLIEDEQGHGTAVTGVIAAAMNGEGVVGVAPEVTIIVIKAECDANGNFLRSSDLVFGLYYAIEAGADVVNMSFGSYDKINPFASPLRLAVDSDILCVAAAGNDGTTALMYPAADPNCISVGALEENGWNLAAYSNYGENVNIVAPGTTFTTKKDGGYGIMNGTSLASPIVAGAMALLKQQNRWIEFAGAQELLYASTYDLGSLGEDFYYGYGALDVAALLTEQRGTVTFNYLTDEIEETMQVFIRNHTLQNLPEPERNFCVFDGWYYDIYCTEEVEWYADEWTSDLTLYAKWANENDGVPYTYVTLDDGTIEIRSYTGHRRYITIPDIIDEKPVTSIGDFAFDGQSRLRQVTLPSRLIKIGQYAFNNCNNLLDITIPDGVTEIGTYAFYNTVRLSQVAFGSGSKLESIGSFAFAFSGLTRFDVPAKLTNLNGSAFYGATKLREFIVARENTAFRSFDGVLVDATGTLLVAYPAAKGMSYTLPDSVTKVGAYTFACARLTEVDLNNTETIGEAAFKGSSLEELTFGEKIVSLGSEAFSRNYNLRSVSFAETIDLAVIPKEAFAFCSSLVSVEIPASVMVVDEAAFMNNVSLTSVSFAEGARLLGIGEEAFEFCTALCGIGIPASVLSIGKKAFSNDSLLASVSFEEGSLLSSIGGEAFAYTVSLTSITFPANLAQIGAYAFHDGRLTGEVTLPASLQTLEEGAFASCHGLTAIGIADENAVYTSVGGVLYNKEKTLLAAYPAGREATAYTPESTTERIGNAAFYGAWNLTTVTLNEGLTAVGEYAFYDCKNVTSYDLPSSLTAIERYAFAKNAELTGVSIPDNVVQISNYAFAGDYRMTDVYFGTESKLPRISFAAFSDTGITSFTVPKNVSTIAQYAFSGSKSLQSLTFAENSKLTTIEAYLFDGCDALRSITFGSGSALTTIQAHGFEGMRNLETVAFGNAALESIGNYAFRYCENLVSVTIPGSVTSIGRFAFYGDKQITRFDIPECVTSIGRFAFYGTNNANVYFALENLPETLQECWDEGIAGYYVGVTNVQKAGDWTYATLSSGGVAILAYAGSSTAIDLTALDFGAPITQIGGYAFYRSSVETVVLPESVDKILAYAFAYSNLQTVTIPANVGFIGKYAFFHATDLTAVVFADGSRLKSIEQYAFGYTGSLASFTLPSSLTTMGSSTFEKSGIVSVTFADGIALTEIPQGAFTGSALTAVCIPASVMRIDHNAFRDCHALETAVFDCESVEILSNVFYNSGLHTVEIGANVAYIGEYAFVGLTNLTAFSVSPENARYASVDGVLYSKDGKKLIAMPAGRTGNFTVPDTVETIGFGAFENTALSAVSFEEGINLLTIGYRAFYNASSLVGITVPESVVSIDYYAFAMCNNLTMVTFAGDNLMGVYEGAFYGDRNLKNIKLPDDVVEISDFAFYGCSSLTSLPISETNEVKGIFDYAFAYSGITYLKIPDSVIDIGEFSFMGSSKLKNIVIPTNNQENLFIGRGAFQECENLESITIPFIGSVFEDETITWFGFLFGAGGYKANNAYVPESLKNVTISEGITFIGTGAFYDLQNLEYISVPFSVTKLFDYSFFQCEAEYEMKNTIYFETVHLSSSYFGKNITGELVLGEGLIEIGYDALRDCKKLSRIVLPDSIESIGPSPFAGCDNLSSVVLPMSLYNREGLAQEGLFYSCPNIRTIEIPDGVTTIPTGFFSCCENLVYIKIPDSVTRIESFAFTGCSSLVDIIIPDSVSYIGDYAFDHCSGLSSITLGTGITIIGDDAFSNCSNLHQIENRSDLVLMLGASENGGIAENANVIIDRHGNRTYLIDDDDFAYVDTSDGFRFRYQNGKYTLIAYLGEEETVTLPSNINGNYYRIDHMIGVKNIIIPPEIGSLNQSAFRDNDSLKSVVISEGVTSIAGSAFEGCDYLERVVIPDSVKRIERFTFEGCTRLTNIIIGKNVRSIGANAFYGCMNLESITIPENVETIDSTAFSWCQNLVDITINPNNQFLTFKDGVLYNKKKTQIVLITDSVTDLVVPKTVTTISLEANTTIQTLAFEEGSQITAISDRAFNYCTNLSSVIIPDSITRIGSWAFANCSSLKSLIIPASVKSIGELAFANNTLSDVQYLGNLDDWFSFSVGISEYNLYDANGLVTHYSIPDGTSVIKDYSFSGCKSLETVTIPCSVTKIGKSAFSGCIGLITLEIPESVTYIDSFAFFGCSNLESVNIPSRITKLSQSVFNGCHSLTKLTIPNNVQSIESFALSGCVGLTNVIIPDSVRTIGERAFESCGVTHLTLGRNISSIGVDAFIYCTKLLQIDNRSDLELGLGTNDNGGVALYAIQLIDRNGIVDLKEGTLSEIIDTPDGFRFKKENGVYTLFAYLGDENTVTLPLTIDGHAYKIHEMRGVINVIIPEGITVIDEEAFSGCSSLKRITIPNSVQSIGNSAFAGCLCLNNVIIPDSVEYLGNSSFFGCDRLVNVSIGSGIKSIGSWTFACCGLINVSLPDTIVSIGHRAFYRCFSLTSITIPDTVSSIESEAFDETPLWNSRSDWSDGGFYCGNALLAVDKTVETFMVREGTTCIAEDAFNGCYSLRRLTIGGCHPRLLRDLTNLEILVLTEMPGNMSISQYFWTVPITLKTIVLKKECFISTDSTFSEINGVRVFVEDDEINIHWDHDFPNWNNGNKVYYGGHWNEVVFYNRIGIADTTDFYTSSQIIRQPFMRDDIEDNCVFVFDGWDLNNDGLSDLVPATSSTNIVAKAIYQEFDYCELYGHNLVHHDAKTATCTAIGWTAYDTCSRCDYTTYSELPAFGHTSSDWIVILEPTCTAAGSKHKVCTVCGTELEVEAIAALGHDLVHHDAKAATCTEIGWNAYDICSRCDYSTYVELPATGHDLIHHDGKAATCTEIGWNAYDTCSRCEYSTYVELPATGHDLIHHDAKAPTCTAIGWNAYDTCSRCDYTTYAELPALGHTSSDWIVTLEPTCTVAGSKHKICTVCGAELEVQAIAALGHDLIHHDAKASTCTAIGWNAYDTCSRCDYTTYIELPATGHDYQANVTPPTQTERGYTTHVCSVCGDSYADSYVDSLAVSESRDLLQELTATLDRIVTVDLSSYSTLKDVYDRSASLTDADRATLNAKLAQMMEEYTQLAQQINAEYSAAEEIENTYFVVILGAVQALVVLAFVSMKGKRCF